MLQFLDLRDLGLTYLNNNCGVAVLQVVFHPFRLFTDASNARELGGDTASLAQGRPETCGHLSVSSDVPWAQAWRHHRALCLRPLWAPLYSDGGPFSENMISPNELLPHFKLETKCL